MADNKKQVLKKQPLDNDGWEDVSLDNDGWEDVEVDAPVAAAASGNDESLARQFGRAALKEGLPVIGGGIGALAGSALGPAGTVAAGGLGYAGGKKLSDMIRSLALGDNTLYDEPVKALASTANDVLSGASQEIGGQFLGKGIEAVGNGVKAVKGWISGPAKDPKVLEAIALGVQKNKTLDPETLRMIETLKKSKPELFSASSTGDDLAKNLDELLQKEGATFDELYEKVIKSGELIPVSHNVDKLQQLIKSVKRSNPSKAASMAGEADHLASELSSAHQDVGVDKALSELTEGVHFGGADGLPIPAKTPLSAGLAESYGKNINLLKSGAIDDLPAPDVTGELVMKGPRDYSKLRPEDLREILESYQNEASDAIGAMAGEAGSAQEKARQLIAKNLVKQRNAGAIDIIGEVDGGRLAKSGFAVNAGKESRKLLTKKLSTDAANIATSTTSPLDKMIQRVPVVKEFFERGRDIAGFSSTDALTALKKVPRTIEGMRAMGPQLIAEAERMSPGMGQVLQKALNQPNEIAARSLTPLMKQFGMFMEDSPYQSMVDGKVSDPVDIDNHRAFLTQRMGSDPIQRAKALSALNKDGTVIGMEPAPGQPSQAPIQSSVVNPMDSALKAPSQGGIDALIPRKRPY